MTEQTAKPFTPAQEKLLDLVIKPISRVNTWVYRLSGGRIFGRWAHGAPIALVTMTGRKTGKKCTAPLLYLRDGERVVVVASKGGSAHHPKWFLNLMANPECEVEIASERRRMRARKATPEEKRQYWPRLIEMYPDYELYQRRSPRDIPVVILEPA